MSNTIQIKRFNETGETPDDRGTVLAYGELAVNTADNTLWVGNNIGVNQLLSAHTRIGPDEPVMPADKLIGTFWFDTTIPESIKVWNGTAFVTFVGGDPVEPGGQVDSVVAGTNVTVDNTDPANPIVSATGGGGGSSDVEVLNDLTDVQVDVGYAGFTEYVSSTALLQENYQYVVAGDYMSFMNATAEAAMQRFVPGDQIIFTWGEGGPGKTVTKTVQDGSQFNNATTEYIRWTSSGGWPTDGAILALPLVLTSTPERFSGAVDGNVLTYNGSQWVPEQPTGGGGATELNDLDDVSVLGHSEGTQYKTPDTLPAAPGEFRVGSTFMQVYVDVEDHWALYEVGDELTFVWNNGDVTGPFTVTTVMQEQNATVRTIYIDGEPGANPNDGGEGTGGGMTVFSNPERAMPKTGEVLTYDGTNWVPQELAEFTDRAVLADLDDVDLGFSVNAGIDDNVIGSVYEVAGAYRISDGSPVLIYRTEIHDQMSLLQLNDIFYFRWPSVDEVKGPFRVSTAPTSNDANTYYMYWSALDGGTPDNFTLPAGGPPMYITFGTPVGHALVFDGINWVAQATVDVLNDLTDVDAGNYAVVMGADGNPESGPGLWEFGGAGNTIIFHNSISAEMSEFLVDDAVYITWPSESLSYGPFIITEAPAFNSASTEYLRVDQTISGISIPAGNPPMSLKRIDVSSGDVLTYNGQEWVGGKGLAAIKEATAAATDFADFQARIAAL